MSEKEIPAIEPAGVFRYRFDNADYDEAQARLCVGGREVVIEPLPLQLLSALLRRPGEVLTREELFDGLWQGRPTVDHALTNAISKLRRALGDPAAARLVNVPRIGYRLQGPVERIAVGRQEVSRVLDLAAGQPVPGREDFMLVRRLTDGGTSDVWLARHRRLSSSRVYKFAADGERLAALKRELTVCRLLSHELGSRPDLVEVQDCNFGAPPFFLGYEEAGTNLWAWATETNELAAMSTQQRIELFLQIARAVAAAHGVGVLHRDLKPANVLIEDRRLADHPAAARWRVRLTDFGSSRLLAPDRLAQLNVTAMGLTVTDGAHPLFGSTPHYVAPELLAGESASTSSDVYALGLILYQLLAGDLRRPMATGWEGDVGDPLLIEDLRSATDGRPERRLASVAQLIERLESLAPRHVQRVEAAAAEHRMQQVARRLEKIRSRRPWLVALTACVTSAVLGIAWLGLQARDAQRHAELANVRTQTINDFLNVDVLQSAHDGGETTGPGTAIDVLARASDRAAERFKGDPPLLAQVRRQLGDVYLRLSLDDQAEFQYLRAIATLEPLVAPADPELQAARFGLAQALTGRERPSEALAMLDAAEHSAGTSPEGRLPRAHRALQARVRVLMDARRYADALPVALQLAVLHDDPSSGVVLDLDARRDARLWLGELQLRLGQGERADETFSALARPPFDLADARAVVRARILLQQAHDEIRGNRLDMAEQALGAVSPLLQAGAGVDRFAPGALADAYYELHRRRGHYAEALAASEAAVKAYDGYWGGRHHRATAARIHVALAELDLGRAADAWRNLETARARIDANGHHDDELRAVDVARARALTDLGRPQDAIDLLLTRASVAPTEDDPPAESELESRAERGRALMALGQKAEGRRLVIAASAGMQQAGWPSGLFKRYTVLLTDR